MENENIEMLNVDQTKLKGKRKPILIIIILLLVVTLIAILGYYFFFYNTSTGIYKRNINKTMLKINESIDEIDEFTKEIELFSKPLGLKTSFDLSTSKEKYDFINSITLNTKHVMDLKNNQYSTTIDINEDNKSFLNIIAYIINNNAYLKSDKLYYRVIEISNLLNNLDSSKHENVIEDYKYVINAFKEAVFNSLDNKYFSKEKVEITLNKETYKLNNIILNYNKTNAKEMNNKIINYLLNDEKFLNILLKYGKMTDETMTISTIKDSLKEINNDSKYEYFTDSKICLYTTKIINKVVGIGRITDVETANFYFIDGNFKYTTKINYYDNRFDETIYTGTYNDKEIIINEEEIGTVKIEFDKNKYLINIENDNLIAKVSNELKKDKNNYKGEFDIDINYSGQKFGATIGYEIIPNDKVENITINSKVNYDELTEEDKNIITTNFRNLLEKTKLAELF